MLDFSKKIVALAPLAGYTDLPFRSVVKKFGADLTVSEMISANAIVHNNKKSSKLIEKSPLETPYSVQIAGNNLETIKRAVEFLNQFDGIDIIDLNSGCPAPKIVNHGSGSALLKDLKKLTEILKTIKQYSNKQLTSAKIRIGFDKKIPLEIAKACEDGGIDFLVVHGRLKIDGFSGSVDYDAIAKIKEALNIPVIANGDIDSAKKAKEVLKLTNADGVMIGRAAIGAPWIFYEIKNQFLDADLDFKKRVILEHLSAMYEYHGEYGIILFRKVLHAYSKGLNNAASFREKVNQIRDYEILKEAIIEFFDNQKAG